MPITGRFEADFAQFSTAVQQAEIQLRSFETGSAKVESQLSRMTDAFSGRKVISDATLMVEAVERIGGTSKLTASELARLNATAAEAAAKMKAMGMDVPPGLAKIAAQAKATTTEFDGMQRVVGSLAQYIAGAFTVGAVVNFGREVLQAGDTIQKMADQTGLSIAQVQKLQYIAGQSGSSIESLVGAVQNLQQRLGDDTTGAAGAIKRLNINLDTFRLLKPYEQMTTLAAAIQRIPDPTEQASAAAAIFGKTWKEILPAIKSGMQEVGEQAPQMADATVKSLDRVGDALTRAKQQAVAWGGDTAVAIEKAGYYFGEFLSQFSPEHFGRMNHELIQAAIELNDPSGLLRALEKIPPIGGAAVESLHALGLSAGEVSRIEKELTDSAKDSIEAHQKLADEAKAAAKIEAQAILETTKLRNEYDTLRVSHGGTANAIAIAQIEQWENNLKAQMHEAGTDTAAFYTMLAALSREKASAVGVDWDFIKTRSLEALREQSANARATYNEMVSGSQHFSREVLDEQLKKVRDLEEAARGMGGAYKKAFDEAATAAKAAADETKRIADEAAKAKAANLAMGGSFEITRENFAASTRGLGGSPDLVEVLLKKGYSFQQALLWSKHPDWAPPQNPGPRVPGFAGGGVSGGGLALVGERGPELLDLPAGTSVTPMNRMGGVTLNTTLYITQPLGTALQIQRVVEDALLRLMRSQALKMPTGA